MQTADRAVPRLVSLALAHLCSPEDQRTIFIDNNGLLNFFIQYLSLSLSTFDRLPLSCLMHAGLELLLDLLGSTSSKEQQDGSVALFKLANKAMSLSPMDAAPPSPTPQVVFILESSDRSILSRVFSYFGSLKLSHVTLNS